MRSLGQEEYNGVTRGGMGWRVCLQEELVGFLICRCGSVGSKIVT